jgi:hypothetical protein
MNLDNAHCVAANEQPARLLLALSVMLLGSLVAGCAGTRLTASPPPPEVQLLAAAELQLPSDCVAASGVVYRTEFEIRPDGRVHEPVSATGNGCVEKALRDWVATFSYAPLNAATPIAFDWMAVTATRID